MAREKILGIHNELLSNYEGDVKILLSKLTPKQYKFYLNIVKDDFEQSRDLITAYQNADYAKTPNDKRKARDLFQSPKIQAVYKIHLEKLQKKQEREHITVFERTDRDLLFIIERAKNSEPPDLALLKTALMDRAKLHGLLIDRHQVINPGQANEIDQSIAAEAEKIAGATLTPQLPGKSADDVIDVEFSDKQPGNEDQSAEKEPPDDDLPDGWLED
jgi:hypothetical protein